MRLSLVGFALLVCVFVLVQRPSFGRSNQDVELDQRRHDLLTTYGQYKNYASSDPMTVYAGLSPDRKAVFDSIVRALFVTIRDHDGKPKDRIIDHAVAVQGVWGVRYQQSEGRYQFRLSVLFDDKLDALLTDSTNIGPGDEGHVMMPSPSDGDDNPNFTGLKQRLHTGRDVKTFREAREPRLQVSLLVNDVKQGDVDIDFDRIGINVTLPNPVCGCHCTPANSDVGSKKPSSTHSHVVDFNKDLPDFTPFSTSWSKPQSHCKEAY